MSGTVDELGRALISIQLRHPTTVAEIALDAWIDTGFTGELVLPLQHISTLGLPVGPVVSAQLADGSRIEVDTFLCLVHWFGAWKQVEVVANQGQIPLLGVGLLRQRHLDVDYRAGTVKVD